MPFSVTSCCPPSLLPIHTLKVTQTQYVSFITLTIVWSWNVIILLLKLLFRSAGTARLHLHTHGIQCSVQALHAHSHIQWIHMHTRTQITNTGSVQTYGNMRLMMNGLPGPVPIPLGAALGCHVCVITLDVILFPLTEAMWILTTVVCLCVFVSGTQNYVMSNWEKKMTKKETSWDCAKATPYTHAQILHVDAVTSEIINGDVDVGQRRFSYSQRSWQ